MVNGCTVIQGGVLDKDWKGRGRKMGVGYMSGLDMLVIRVGCRV